KCRDQGPQIVCVLLLKEIEIGADTLQAKPAIGGGRARRLDSSAASAGLGATYGSEAVLLFPIIQMILGPAWPCAVIAGSVSAGHQSGENAIEGVHGVDVQHSSEIAGYTISASRHDLVEEWAVVSGTGPVGLH